MKSAGRQSKTTTAPSTKSKSGSVLSCTKSKSSSTEAAKKRRKATGKANKACERPLPSPTRLFGQEMQALGTSFQKITPGTPATVPGQCPQCFKKLRLQLFPIDDVTRKGLEKDKHNPYLELTLGSLKKISSVVKHLNNKWGNSKIASGELMLLPYSAQLDNLASSRRWTVKDCSINAADVRAAVGNPAVFRLRYGWFSSSKTEICGVPLTSPHFEGNLQSKESDKIYITNEKEHAHPASIQEGGHQEMNVSDKKEHASDRSQEDYPLSSRDLPNQSAGMTADGSVQIPVHNSMKMNSNLSLLWPDGVSNISCGALLSEASRALDDNRCHQLPVQNNSGLQQTTITCDSFDAAIAAHIARFQGTNPPASAQVSQPSIWDAEETCHAFPFRKITTSKDAPVSCSKAPFTSCSQDDFSNSIRFCNMLDAQVEAKDAALQKLTSNLEDQRKTDACLDLATTLQPETQGDPCKQPITGLQSCAEVTSNGCNDLGKIDFSLSESLGPWVNGISSSRQMLDGDNISLSSLIASSLDAFQNCSVV